MIEAQPNGGMIAAQQNVNDGPPDSGGSNVTEEKSTPEPNDGQIKQEEQTDGLTEQLQLVENPNENCHQLNGPNISMQLPPPGQQQQQQQIHQLQQRFTSAPQTMMAVPPPVVSQYGLQHIVGNTGGPAVYSISSQPANTQTHYTSVSLQALQPPPGQQQIHVSSTGQHFLVNTQFPQQTFQQVQQVQQVQQMQQVPQNVQSFQLTAAPQRYQM